MEMWSLRPVLNKQSVWPLCTLNRLTNSSLILKFGTMRHPGEGNIFTSPQLERRHHNSQESIISSNNNNNNKR